MKYSRGSDFLNKTVKIVFDRPLGTKHPKFDWVYPINYGYIPDTKSEDGMEIDAYYLSADSSLDSVTGVCIGYIHRDDDNEDKLIVVDLNDNNYTDQQILEMVHFQEKWYKSKLIRN